MYKLTRRQSEVVSLTNARRGASAGSEPLSASLCGRRVRRELETTQERSLHTERECTGVGTPSVNVGGSERVEQVCGHGAHAHMSVLAVGAVDGELPVQGSSRLSAATVQMFLHCVFAPPIRSCEARRLA